MKLVAASGALALMLAATGNAAPSDLKVTGSVSARTDAAAAANCRLTTKQKTGTIHLSGTWSCTLDK